jgi:hypothetical protein
MASRNYGNAYNTEYNRDLLEDLHANDMYRDTNGQPTYMEPQRLFRGARDYTDRFSRSVGGAMCGDIGRYGGNFVNDRGEVVNEILNHPHIYRGATDAGQPLRRPPGMISPHHKMAFQKILPGSMAYLPQYNAEELYDVNQEEYQVNVFEEIMDDNNGRGYSGGNVGEIYRDEGGNFVAPTQSMMGAGKMGDAYRRFADSDLGQSVIPIAKMGAKSGLKKLASTLIHNPIYRSAANKMIEDQIGSGAVTDFFTNIKNKTGPSIDAEIRRRKGGAGPPPGRGGVKKYSLDKFLTNVSNPEKVREAADKSGITARLATSPELASIGNYLKKLTGGGPLSDLASMAHIAKDPKKVRAALQGPKGQALMNIAKEINTLRGGGDVKETIADELIAMLKPHINKLGTALLPEGKKLYKKAKKEIDKILGSGWGAAEGYNPDNTPMTDEQREAYYQKSGVDIRKKQPYKLPKMPLPEVFGKPGYLPAMPRPAVPRLPSRKLLGDKYAALGSGLDLTHKKQRGRPKKVPLPPSVQKVLDGEPSKTIQVVGGAVKRGRGRPRKDGGMFTNQSDRNAYARGINLAARLFGQPSIQPSTRPVDPTDIFETDRASPAYQRETLLYEEGRKEHDELEKEKLKKMMEGLDKRTRAYKDLMERLKALEKDDSWKNDPMYNLEPTYGSGKPKKRGRPRKGGNVEMTIENMVQKVAPTNSADKRKARAALIKKVMSEMKLKLGEASKYIKENNLI